MKASTWYTLRSPFSTSSSPAQVSIHSSMEGRDRGVYGPKAGVHVWVHRQRPFGEKERSTWSTSTFSQNQTPSASHAATIKLTCAAGLTTWVTGCVNCHPRATGWRDLHGFHHVYMSADDWTATFPSFASQTHRTVLRHGKALNVLHTVRTRLQLNIRVGFAELIQLYLAFDLTVPVFWLTLPPPAEGTQLSADVELDVQKTLHDRECAQPQSLTLQRF